MPERWVIPPELERRMVEVARELRKNPTASGKILWQAIRERQLKGRRFRRQVPIGPFVLIFTVLLNVLWLRSMARSMKISGKRTRNDRGCWKRWGCVLCG